MRSPVGPLQDANTRELVADASRADASQDWQTSLADAERMYDHADSLAQC